MSEQSDQAGGVSAERLKAYIERIERLTDDKDGIGTDIKEVYLESKGFGFEPKLIKQIVKLRRMEADARAEADALLEAYRAAIGL